MFLPPRVFLLTIILCLVTVSVALVFSGIFSVEKNRKDLIQEIRGTASVISVNSSAALAFDDRELAQRNLDSLRFNADISLACLYTDEGYVLAAFNQANTDSSCLLQVSQLLAIAKKPYSFFSNIEQKGQIVGHIYLESDGQRVTTMVHYYLYMAAMLILGTILFIGIPLAWRIQRGVNQPIRQLSNDLVLYLESPQAHKNSWMQLQEGIYQAVKRINYLTEENQLRKIVNQTTLNFLDNELAEKYSDEIVCVKAKEVGFFDHNSRVFDKYLNESVSATGVLKDAVQFSKKLNFDNNALTNATFSDSINAAYNRLRSDKTVSNLFLHFEGTLIDGSPELYHLAQSNFFDILFSFLKIFAHSIPDSPVYVVINPTSQSDLLIKVISTQNEDQLMSTSQNRFLFFQLATIAKISRCSMKINVHKGFFILKLCSKMENGEHFNYISPSVESQKSIEEELYNHLLENDVVITKDEFDDKKNLMHLISSITDSKIRYKILKLLENLESEEI